MTPIAGELEAANEIDDARFVPIAEARALLTYARDRELLELARDHASEPRPPHPPREGEEPARVGRSPTTCVR